MQVHNLVDVDTHLPHARGLEAAGRVRDVGVTHYVVDSHHDLERLREDGRVDLVQCNYSLAVRDAERRLLPLAAERRIATVINRPFESGGMFERVARVPLLPAASALGCHSWAALFLKYVI